MNFFGFTSTKFIISYEKCSAAIQIPKEGKGFHRKFVYFDIVEFLDIQSFRQKFYIFVENAQHLFGRLSFNG